MPQFVEEHNAASIECQDVKGRAAGIERDPAVMACKPPHNCQMTGVSRWERTDVALELPYHTACSASS